MAATEMMNSVQVVSARSQARRALGLLGGRATLGPFAALLLATAFFQIYSQQQTIENPGSALTYFGRTFALGGTTTITYGVVVMLGLFAFFGFLLSQTAWGTRIYALGSSAASTRLAGVRTDRLLVSVYVVAGLIYGVAALLLIGRTGVGDPNAGTTDNLDSIT